MSEPVVPAVAELLAVVARLEAALGERDAVIAALRGEVAVLRRRLGRDSSNSSRPPSSDDLSAQGGVGGDDATQTPHVGGEAVEGGGDRRGGGRRGGGGGKRRPGGQAGRRGSTLEWVSDPDQVVRVEPGSCAGCGGYLSCAEAGSVGAGVQVTDIPAVTAQVTEYQMMTRTCGGCGHATTAPAPQQVPAGVSGGTCYGQGVRATAAFLASSDVIGVARATVVLAALLGLDVSTGFVAACLARLDEALVAAGFEDAVKAGLRAAGVIGTDESPVRIAGAQADTDTDTDRVSTATAGRRRRRSRLVYLYTARTMNAYTCGPGPGRGDLLWYGAAASRSGAAIDAFAILPGYAGVLVGDDYGGYLKDDTHLQAVQLCVAHLLRDLSDAGSLGAEQQAWTTQAARALREAITAVNTARAQGIKGPQADADLGARLARSRGEYDAATAVGASINLSRPWAGRGNHPALVLATRLERKAAQVWTFTTRFDVPATNNGSETAIRGAKIAQKVSGCWRHLQGLQRYARIRSYLETTRTHHIQAITAIRDALTGNPWMPHTA